MMNWSMKNLFSAAPALSIVPALPPELAALLKREREQQQYLQYGQASLTNGMDSKMMMMLVSGGGKHNLAVLNPCVLCYSS